MVDLGVAEKYGLGLDRGVTSSNSSQVCLGTSIGALVSWDIKRSELVRAVRTFIHVTGPSAD